MRSEDRDQGCVDLWILSLTSALSVTYGRWVAVLFPNSASILIRAACLPACKFVARLFLKPLPAKACWINTPPLKSLDGRESWLLCVVHFVNTDRDSVLSILGLMVEFYICICVLSVSKESFVCGRQNCAAARCSKGFVRKLGVFPLTSLCTDHWFQSSPPSFHATVSLILFPLDKTLFH